MHGCTSVFASRPHRNPAAAAEIEPATPSRAAQRRSHWATALGALQKLLKPIQNDAPSPDPAYSELQAKMSVSYACILRP